MNIYIIDVKKDCKYICNICGFPLSYMEGDKAFEFEHNDGGESSYCCSECYHRMNIKLKQEELYDF